MMYRPFSAFRSAKAFKNTASAAAKSIAEATTDTVTALFVQLGIMERAERENRRRDRFIKRRNKHSNYSAYGLNGPRAVARRLRQIEAGSLREANGLVRS